MFLDLKKDLEIAFFKLNSFFGRLIFIMKYIKIWNRRITSGIQSSFFRINIWIFSIVKFVFTCFNIGLIQMNNWMRDSNRISLNLFHQKHTLEHRRRKRKVVAVYQLVWLEKNWLCCHYTIWRIILENKNHEKDALTCVIGSSI